MFKVKSFKISDDKGVSELLSKFRIAEGASIFVSNGEIMIPIEDGTPENVAQKIVRLQEEKNKIVSGIEIIDHSQKVLLNKVNGANEQLNILKNKEAEFKKEKNSKDSHDEKQTVKSEIKRMNNVIAQFEVAMVNNQAELTNKNVELDVYNEEIKGLEV